jgi:SanA protein
VPVITKKRIILLIGILVVMLVSPFTFLFLSYQLQKNDSTSKVALVLGAGIKNNRYPSKVLENRLEQSIELYKSGQIKYFLVSGDNTTIDYNEPEVMQNYLIKQGIPKENIIADFGGRRTIDSCWRAKNAFKADSVVIVSQSFHLPRAQFLCNSVGLKTFTSKADDSSWQVKINGYVREIPASIVALWEAWSNYEAEIKPDGKEVNVQNLK